MRGIRGARTDGRALVAAHVASGAGGVAAWAILRPLPNGPGFMLGLAAGAAEPGMAAALLRVIPASDAAWLEQAASGRLAGVVTRVCRPWGARPPEAPA